MLITTLGTSHGDQMVNRYNSSTLYESGDNLYIFDAGEPVTASLVRLRKDLTKVKAIFITHMHGDHIYGLPGLLSSRGFQGGTEPITVYGPKGIRGYIQSSLRFSGTRLSYPIRFVEFDQPGIIFEDHQFTVSVEKLQHGIPSFGFRIVEADHEGTLDAKKLHEMNIPSGPLYGRLKNKEIVTLEDGRVLDGKDFVGPNQKGRVLAILGDTVKHPNSVKLAENADVVVHEGTFSHEELDLAKQYNHSTVTQAAEVAREAKAKKLLLTHFSSRYLYKDLLQLEKEAQRIFPYSKVVKDLQEVIIPLEKGSDKE